LEESAAASRVYDGSLSRLRRELTAKNEEITRLVELVEEYRTENESLISTVQIQKTELEGLEAEIDKKRKELASLDNELKTVKADSKQSEADALFARAKAVEETAQRTKFAGKKKKKTLREALELYEKAHEMGSKEAKAEIDRMKSQHFSAL